jgi:hypothetical protein
MFNSRWYAMLWLAVKYHETKQKQGCGEFSGSCVCRDLYRQLLLCSEAAF